MPAQTVELRCNGYYVAWTFTGTVIADNFASQWCGRNIGTYDHDKNAGKTESMHYQLYAYQDLDSIDGMTFAANGELSTC